MARKREKRRNGDVDIIIAMVLREMFDLPPSPGVGAGPSSGAPRSSNGSRGGRSASPRRREARRSVPEPPA
jgi:hypothetical protein